MSLAGPAFLLRLDKLFVMNDAKDRLSAEAEDDEGTEPFMEFIVYLGDAYLAWNPTAEKD